MSLDSTSQNRQSRWATEQQNLQTSTSIFWVELRRKHPTVHAARGVRTRDEYGADSGKRKERTVRQRLIQKFHDVRREERDKPIGTGLERAARWRASAPGGRGEQDDAGRKLSKCGTQGGGSGNKGALKLELLISCTNLNCFQAAQKRRKVFTQAQVPNLLELVDARVSRMKPIKVDDFGIIWTAEGVRVAKGERLASDWFTRCIEGPSSDMGKLVIALHSKGGGKHGKHEGITESTTITAISYASVQVYEHFHGAHFHDIPEATALLRTRQFAHIPSHSCAYSLVRRAYFQTDLNFLSWTHSGSPDLREGLVRWMMQW
jgi:hypothetical protein